MDDGRLAVGGVFHVDARADSDSTADGYACPHVYQHPRAGRYGCAFADAVAYSHAAADPVSDVHSPSDFDAGADGHADATEAARADAHCRADESARPASVQRRAADAAADV